MLTAGIWVGGLVVLVVLGRTVEKESVRRFSTLALTAVVVLVATGVLNSLRNLHSVDELFLTRYGVLLLVKLALIAATLAAAAVSRSLGAPRPASRGIGAHRGRPDRLRAHGHGVLSMTSPPPRISGRRRVRSRPHRRQRARRDVAGPPRAPPGMGIIPATTRGSRLNLLLTDRSGQPLPATGRRAQGQQPIARASAASRCR